MKKTLTLLLALALSASLFGQHNHRPCYTDEAMKHLFANDPAAKARFEQSQNEGEFVGTMNQRQIGPNQTLAYAFDTIPVVVHILHMNGPENISNAQVMAALDEVNKVFRKGTSDTANIDPYFQPTAEAANIVFKLATKDPNGNCTNGIIRHYDANTDWDQGAPGYAYTGTQPGRWNPSKYMNIYIVKQIIPAGGSSGGGTIVGYTYLPGTWSTGSSADAIVYHNGFLGGSDARSLAHEIGHWLGLPHTFGNTNNPGVSCGDDNIDGGIAGTGVTDDTPMTVGFFSTCPGFGTTNSCDASNHANIQNIMDYSSCPINFTIGQAKRMRNVMTLSTSGRNNLSSATNKTNTGIRNPQVCAPVAEFRSNKRAVCATSSVQFSDSTLNTTVTAWNWDFPGGTPSTSMDSMPNVQYNTPGVYAVTYTATNSAGNNTISKSNFITVVNNVATVQSGLSESFESITVPNSDWTINNDGGGVTWAQTSAAGATGLSSITLNNFSNTVGQVDEFYTPSYNLNALYISAPPVSFKFKVAYQQKATTNADKLQVLSSTNCGQTWTSRYSKAGSVLSTAGTGSGAFTPTAAQWRTETVNVLPISNQTNVLFKFVFTSDATAPGNNIYIDDINIMGATVGIEDNTISNLLNLQVFPNPSAGQLNISFDTYDKHTVNLCITDMLGKVVQNVSSNSSLNPGTHRFQVGNGELPAGLYFMSLNIDGQQFSQKIVVE